jgi:HlyD family secretion protein
MVVTGAALYFAWFRTEDGQRIFKRPMGATNSVATTPTHSPSSSKIPGATNGEPVLTVSGYIVNRERIELSPRFLGLVKWIGVKKGDAVTNGQVVVLLDDAEQRARLAEAKSHFSGAQVALERANLDYERILKLDTIESKQTADDLRLKVEAAKVAIKEAQAQVDLNKTYLDWTVIRSPINGVVLEKLVDANELVTPQSFGGTRGPSTALIAIADLKDLQVEVDLNEADLAKVDLNQFCRISPEAYPDKAYEGYVAEIAPEANRQKGTLQVKVQIKNPDRFLTPELTAKVEFLKGQ